MPAGAERRSIGQLEPVFEPMRDKKISERATQGYQVAMCGVKGLRSDWSTEKVDGLTLTLIEDQTKSKQKQWQANSEESLPKSLHETEFQIKFRRSSYSSPLVP